MAFQISSLVEHKICEGSIKSVELGGDHNSMVVKKDNGDAFTLVPNTDPVTNMTKSYVVDDGSKYPVSLAWVNIFQNDAAAFYYNMHLSPNMILPNRYICIPKPCGMHRVSHLDYRSNSEHNHCHYLLELVPIKDAEDKFEAQAVSNLDPAHIDSISKADCKVSDVNHDQLCWNIFKVESGGVLKVIEIGSSREANLGSTTEFTADGIVLKSKKPGFRPIYDKDLSFVEWQKIETVPESSNGSMITIVPESSNRNMITIVVVCASVAVIIIIAVVIVCSLKRAKSKSNPYQNVYQ